MSWEQQAVRNRLNMAVAMRAHGIVEVPGELALQQSDLIDRVVAFAFDVLGWQTLEIRVRPQVEHINVTTKEKTPCQPTN